MTGDEQEILRATRRTVGIATLRRLRRLVDEENDLESRQTRWVLLIGILFSAAFAVFLAWLLGRTL